jgi:IS5 family transposase
LRRVGEKSRGVEERKTNAGHKLIDAILLFRMLVLQHLYTLADQETEYPIRDRYAFARCLGVGSKGHVHDGISLWLFREALKNAGVIGDLFDLHSQQIEAAGLRAQGGQIIDAAVHDSQCFDELLDPRNSRRDIWVDSAYRSKERKENLMALRYRSHIQRKGRKGKPLSETAQRANRARAKIRPC